MVQVAVTDLAAYFDDEITAMPNLVTTAATTVGALDSGSITSGFGNIDTGSSTITTTGLITGGSLDIDDVVINGTTIGHTDDTDLITLADGIVTVAGEISVTTLDIGGTNVTASAADINLIDGITNGTVIASKAIITDANKDISGGRNITISGELDAATLDISGNADIDGTLEADAITVDGTALDEFISDTVGAMVGSNTETGVTVSYDDSDNTLDFVLGTAQTTIESLKNTSLVIGRDDDNLIKFGTDNQIIFEVSGGDNVIFKASGEIEASSLDISGDADIDGTLEADAITVNGTALNTVIAGVTVTNATTAAVATTVTISDNESTDEDNAIIFTSGGDVDGGNIGLESDGDLTYNPSTGRLTATQLSGTLQTAAQGNITSLGTLTTLTVDNVIINGSTIGHTGDTDLMTVASGVLTVAGEVDATSLDISGDADIDGTLEADAITVNGTALNTVIGNEATALAIALG
jgi:cytoskeletal protein CcmA (bactofilin family)